MTLVDTCEKYLYKNKKQAIKLNYEIENNV